MNIHSSRFKSSSQPGKCREQIAGFTGYGLRRSVSVFLPGMSQLKKDRLLERYIQYLEVERHASPRTIIAYRQALRKFSDFAGDKVPWQVCTAQQFRAFLLDCMKAGMARSYVRLTFAALRSFYKYRVEREGLRDNPLREVQLPKMEKKLPVVLSIGQVDELLTAPTEDRTSGSGSSLVRSARRGDDGVIL